MRNLIGMTLSLALVGCAELGIDARQVEGLLGTTSGRGAGLDESTVVAGLKEALQVGTERAVDQTSQPGGFLDDALLRIALPDELQSVAKGMRAVGLGAQVDEVEVSMNRAAESASAEATDVFWQAVSSMSISDAYGILNGPDDAATTYFRGRTEGTLRERFSPVVESAMQSVGLYQAYDRLVQSYGALALFSDPKADLNRHVTDETLDGLFTVLASEEKRIREDPVARSSELLQKVFGGR
ncbi:MAG: DUF4197 domain-containing protein [Myxococcota bacterium]